MLNSKDILEKCQSLQRRGVLFSREIGCRVGRGFADVGFEEFYVLPRNRLVSLLTGEVSSLQQNDDDSLFVIPTLDQLIDRMQRGGWDLESFDCVEQRLWVLQISNEGSALSFEAKSPLLAGLDALNSIELR